MQLDIVITSYLKILFLTGSGSYEKKSLQGVRGQLDNYNTLYSPENLALQVPHIKPTEPGCIPELADSI